MKLFSKFYKKILLIIIAGIGIFAGANSCCNDNSVRPLYGVNQDSTRKDSIVPLYGAVPEYGVRGTYMEKPVTPNEQLKFKKNIL